MTTKENTLTLRNAKWDDVQAVAKLMYAVSEADGDASVAETPEDIEHNWQSPGYNPETDSFVVETEDKQIVGYWEMFNGRNIAQLELDGYVHPNYKDTPVAEMLIKRAEERAMQAVPLVPPDERVYIRSAMPIKDEFFRALHEKFGYTAVRYFWRMEINLTEAPTLAPLLEGLEFRPFIKEEHAQAVWMADNEAFRDHWGSHDSEYEEWSHRKFEIPDYDPTLWLVVWDGDEIAGFSQNRYLNDTGWVGTLGVRRNWRKKGLGLALLTHSFAEFYKRGTQTIGLGVDAASPTGATRLYQKAGMSVANEYVAYEKELRAGKTDHKQQTID